MHPNKAAEVLGVDLATATETQVRSAAASAMAAAHPDSGGDPELAPGQIALAKNARDVLVRHLQSGAPPGKRACPVCQGKGRIRAGGFKALECPRCKTECWVDL